jgi:hypothetical protein
MGAVWSATISERAAMQQSHMLLLGTFDALFRVNSFKVFTQVPTEAI